MAEELIELLALSEPVYKKILPIKPVHKKPPFPEVPTSVCFAKTYHFPIFAVDPYDDPKSEYFSKRGAPQVLSLMGIRVFIRPSRHPSSHGIETANHCRYWCTPTYCQ
jgi:hypothetical protein